MVRFGGPLLIGFVDRRSDFVYRGKTPKPPREVPDAPPYHLAVRRVGSLGTPASRRAVRPIGTGVPAVFAGTQRATGILRLAAAANR